MRYTKIEMVIYKRIGILILSLWFCLQSLYAQEHFSIAVDPQLWAEGLKTVRSILEKKRSGYESPLNNDHYTLDWLAYITPEHIDFQSYAVWIDLTLGAKFEDPERRLKTVLERLQSEMSIKQTECFLEEHCYTLSESELKYGVDSSIISGIVNIESFLGSYKGVVKFPTFSTLISWVALQNEDFRKHVLDQYFIAADVNNGFKNNQTDKIFTEVKQKFSDQTYWNNRATKRARKSISQLRDFLNIAQSMQWEFDSVIKIQGSWVGAFTDGQFMPVTLRYILKPGEKIDPHSLDDVILLIARYLSRSWGDSKEQIDRAIKSYNSPKWYRNHVITVGDLVKSRWDELLEESKEE